MGVDVRLEDERGKALAGIGDPHNRLARLVPDWQDRSYVCWRFIDHYGDTTFNALQMPDFLAELDRLRAQTDDEADQRLLNAVRVLAERCRDDAHLYLKFIGD